MTIKVWEWEENMWREKKEGIVKTEQKGELYDNDSSLAGGIYATLQCLFFLHFIRLHMFRTKCSFCSFSLFSISRFHSRLLLLTYLCFSLLIYVYIYKYIAFCLLLQKELLGMYTLIRIILGEEKKRNKCTKGNS